MATIFYGVTSPELNLDVKMSLSDADSQRIMTYLVAGSPYGTVTENVQYKVYDESWVPEPGQTEADRPLIPDPDWVPEAPLTPDAAWVPEEGQTEADRPMIPDPSWPSEAPLIPDAAWEPTPGQTEDDRPFYWAQHWVTRQATPEEAAKAYATAVMNSLLADTLSWEKAQAGADAANNVPPITPINPPATVPPV